MIFVCFVGWVGRIESAQHVNKCFQKASPILLAQTAFVCMTITFFYLPVIAASVHISRRLAAWSSVCKSSSDRILDQNELGIYNHLHIFGDLPIFGIQVSTPAAPPMPSPQ